MKYALFGGACYYAGGGVDDFISYFNSAEQAKEYVEFNKTVEDIFSRDGWAQIASVGDDCIEMIEWTYVNSKDPLNWRGPDVW